MNTITSIESPCNSECRLDPETDLCTGCFRTMDEIIRWPFINDDDRLKILEKINQRKKDKPDLAN